MGVIGVALFALAILISVSLHEAGHMVTAKAFGMKVTRYFVGFGPTVWSFRRGETEYGLKGIPLGGFCKIVGMTPQDDDVEPADEPRAMWRFPVWKRTIVMSAGSITHFALGFVVLWALFAFVALPDADKLDQSVPTVNKVSDCLVLDWELDGQQPRECVKGKDPTSPAAQIGLRSGDVLTALDGQPLTGWEMATEKIRASGGRTVTLTYERDGATHTATVAIPSVQRPKQDLPEDTTYAEVTQADLERVGVLGITPIVPTSVAGPIGAFGEAGNYTKQMIERTFVAMKDIPQRVPALWHSLTGSERDPNTPMSVVGASRLGGELAENALWTDFFVLLAGLNFFVGVFNLLPLLPLDGGHIAIAWFERSRSWLYARIGRKDPGRVDYFKLMPVTYVVLLIGGAFTLLTVAADIVNPITLFGK